MKKNKSLVSLLIILLASLVCFFPLAKNQDWTVHAEEPLVFIALGDSLSSGYLVGNVRVESYTTSIANAYRNKFGAIVHYSEGVEGFLSQDMLNRLQNTALLGKIKSADQIVLNIGLEDIMSVVNANYAALNVTLTSQQFQDLLTVAMTQFEQNFNQIIHFLVTNTKTSAKISTITPFNPYRFFSNKSISTLVQPSINAMQSIILSAVQEKVEVIDVKTQFDTFSSLSNYFTNKGTIPYFLTETGHTEIASMMISNMQVLQPEFAYSIALTHEGDLNQLYSQETPITFGLYTYPGVVVGETISWYVNETLVQQSSSLTYQFLPYQQGLFDIKVMVDGYLAHETVKVDYKEIDFLSLNFDGLLFQTLELSESVTFYIDIFTANPNVPVVWTVNDLLVDASTPDGLSYVFTPEFVGSYRIKVQRGDLFSEKTVFLDYAPVSDFSLNFTGYLDQIKGNTSTVYFDVSLPFYSNPETQVEWFVNNVLQDQTTQFFDFLPNAMGNYNIKAKIGNVVKSKDIVVHYAPIDSFELTINGSLIQSLNEISSVVFEFTLPENTDPNTVAQWSVNNVRRTQLTKLFQYTPTQVGTYVIEAKIGEVIRVATIQVNYLPIQLSDQKLGMYGETVQYTFDLQPILFSVDISEYSNANDIRWYVNGQLQQTVGKEFWFLPPEPADDIDRIYYIVQARLTNSTQESNPFTVTVYRGGAKSLNFYGILFVVVSSFTMLILVSYVYKRIRNRDLVV